jgi:hypothetical protein
MEDWKSGSVNYQLPTANQPSTVIRQLPLPTANCQLPTKNINDFK